MTKLAYFFFNLQINNETQKLFINAFVNSKN